MKCVIDRCRRQAICRYCDRHSPLDLLNLGLERRSASSTDDTVNTRGPSWLLDAASLEAMPDHIPLTVLRTMTPMEFAVLSCQWRDRVADLEQATEDLESFEEAAA